MIKTWEDAMRADGDPWRLSEECYMQAEIDDCRAKIAELEANERAYTTIIGERSYQEVADDLKRLEAWEKNK